MRTFTSLRWLAVAGQLVAVVFASEFLGIGLRLDLCLLAIAASLAFNLITAMNTRPNLRLSDSSAMLTLIFDLLQLGVLLFLTGGLSNPFALLVLAPVTIAATALKLTSAVVVAALGLTMISGLVFWNIPLQTADGTLLTPPPLFIAGTWSALVIGTIFLAAYARWITIDSFAMSQALSATQMALEREQKLTDLGGVVAATAHELGTPLATIKLVSSEMREELADRPELLEDINLIGSQAERCRDILRDMGRSGRDDRLLKHAPILSVVEEAAAPHLDRGKTVIIRVDGGPAEVAAPDQPTIPRQSEIIHGIRNLVQNAVDFAANTVWIDIYWEGNQVEITVGDDGIGYPQDLFARIGDPFVRRRRRTTQLDPMRPEYEGMGLGLFIAITLLERSGATLSFNNGRKNRTADAELPAELSMPSGAIAIVRWPRDQIEVKREDLRQPLGHNALNTA